MLLNNLLKARLLRPEVLSSGVYKQHQFASVFAIQMGWAVTSESKFYFIFPSPTHSKLFPTQLHTHIFVVTGIWSTTFCPHTVQVITVKVKEGGRTWVCWKPPIICNWLSLYPSFLWCEKGLVSWWYFDHVRVAPKNGSFISPTMLKKRIQASLSSVLKGTPSVFSTGGATRSSPYMISGVLQPESKEAMMVLHISGPSFEHICRKDKKDGDKAR